MFNETADIVLAVRLDTRHVDSTEDEASEFTINGELPQACDLAGERAKLSQSAAKHKSPTEKPRQMSVYRKRTVFLEQSLGKRTWRKE